MLTQLRKTWPYALGLAAFHVVVPPVWTAVAQASAPDDPTVGKNALFTCLILLNPAVTLVVGALVGYRHAFAWLFPIVAGLAFVPAALVVYNASALVYAAPYLVITLVGLLIGWGVARVVATASPVAR